MGSLCDLFFELSNEDRLRILQQLNNEAMNATKLSRVVNLRIQETSRHLSRLAEVGVTRREGGLHCLTLFGKLVLKQTRGLEFLSQHRHYFSTHTVEHLPSEFVYRLGDLSNSRYCDDVSITFFNVEKIISSARKYIWMITDNYLLSSMPLIGEALERQVEIRNIEPKDLVPPTEIVRAVRADVQTRTALIRGRAKGFIEERLVQPLDTYLYMSEKELVTFAFPVSDSRTCRRRFDYIGFTATDKRAHQWCHDLFQYYWQSAQPREALIDDLCIWIKKKPRVFNALKRTATGKEFSHGKDVISELEGNFLMSQGKLTILGLRVLAKLQQ